MTEQDDTPDVARETREQARIRELVAELAKERQELADCTRDGQRLSQLLAEEEDTTEALEATLRALVANDPPVTKCWHCGAQGVWTFHGDSALWGAPTVHMAHTPDCPIAVGRTLLLPP